MKTSFFKTGKFLLTSALLLSLSLSITNCSKDDDPAQPVVLAPLQDPLPGFLAATGFDQQTVSVINSGDYEFGFSFIPAVNGKITAITVKNPDIRMGLRVTIWDKVAGTILRTETLDVPTADVEVTKEITPLDLVKDKEYFITYNSDDWYNRTKTDGSAVVYPFTIGDIKIMSYAFANGDTQTMPTEVRTTYYAGDCSFKFQK